MAKYRKKPVEIEAWSVRELNWAAGNDWSKLPSPIAEAYERGEILFLAQGIEIETPEGWHKGSQGDMVIQGVNGELYPCKPDIFHKTYEPVD